MGIWQEYDSNQKNDLSINIKGFKDKMFGGDGGNWTEAYNPIY